MNTVIPYTNPRYRDYRPTLGIPEEMIVPLTDTLGLHPSMAPLKKYWDEGKLAIIQGIGYPNGSLSHFRSMDIWATCEPEILGVEGWLGRMVKQLDPNKENVLTGVNFGRGLPRALAMEGVPIASVGDLNSYGLLTELEREEQRNEALDLFGRMYGPAIGRGAVEDFIRSTGVEAMMGADILGTAPGMYRGEGRVPAGQHRRLHARHGAGSQREPGNPGVLHHGSLQHLRHPRQPGGRPVQPAERRGPQRRLVHG